MGNMTHQFLLTNTNIGQIGEASNGLNSYFFIKPQKSLDELMHLSQLNLEKNNQDVFNEQSNFRNYLSFEPNENVQHYYLTKLEGELFINKILEFRKQKKMFLEDEIKDYLKQLLFALFQLHQQEIPGRIFSVFNIFLTKENKIVLFDFGCASKIEQEDLPIFGSPEYLKNLLDNKVQPHHQKFDLKFDIWMIGVFLYHLLKRKPICCIKNEDDNKSTIQKYRSIEKQYNDILTKKHSFQIQNYSKDLQQLIKNMLNVDVNQRIDFYQLYQTEYIQYLDKYEFQKQWYQGKNYLHPQRFSTLKLQSYIQTSLSSQIKSKITNQITQSDEPQMKSIQCPKKQEILALKLNDDSTSKDFLFYLKIFCLKILLLEKLEQLCEKKPIIKEIKAYQSYLELKFHYMVVLSFKLYKSQITEILKCLEISSESDLIQLFRLKQDEEKNTLLEYEDYKLQEFIYQNIITQFQNLDLNDPLILLCCVYYSDPFTKKSVNEFIENYKLQISLDEFPFEFYCLFEKNDQQFKNKLFNYLKEKYKNQK